MMPLILTVALLRRAEHLRNQLNFVEMWLTETTGPPRACLECWTALKMTKPEVGNRNPWFSTNESTIGTGGYWLILALFIWGGTIWEYFILEIGLLGNRGSAEWSWDNREGYREEIDSLAPSSAYLKTYKPQMQRKTVLLLSQRIQRIVDDWLMVSQLF